MKATRTLIVDDVTQVREDLRTMLTLVGGIEVVGEAVNGVDAIQKAEGLQPDLILMDLEMPVLDGYEATLQIKAHCPHCRVIALTVHDHPNAQEKALQVGMDGFIVKGAPLEALLDAITKS